MKLYWLGPTMGKTYAADRFPRVIDFDEFARPYFKELADKLGLTIKEMKSQCHPDFVCLFKELLNRCKNIQSDCVVFVSNAIGLRYREYFEVLMMPYQDDFLQRSEQRNPDCDLDEAYRWYQDLLHKYNASKYCVFDHRTVTQLIKDNFIKI